MDDACGIGPKHLRILEVDFLKPQSRNHGARELEPKPKSVPPPRRLQVIQGDDRKVGLELATLLAGTGPMRLDVRLAAATASASEPAAIRMKSVLLLLDDR